MEIRTKFKINDKVIPIGKQFRKSEWKVFGISECESIFVNIYLNNENEEQKRTYYNISNSPLGNKINEKDLFFSEEEAQAECDKRNLTSPKKETL